MMIMGQYEHVGIAYYNVAGQSFYMDVIYKLMQQPTCMMKVLSPNPGVMPIMLI